MSHQRYPLGHYLNSRKVKRDYRRKALGSLTFDNGTEFAMHYKLRDSLQIETCAGMTLFNF